MAFVAAMDSRVLGANDAPALATSGTALVDFFFKTVRDLSHTELDALFEAARAEAGTDVNALADLVVLAFATRNCRGGKGEKDLFYRILCKLAASLGAETVEAVLPLVPSYGTFKDLLAIHSAMGPGRVAERCIDIFVETLSADEAELKAAEAEKRAPKLSLCGKWAPREGGAHDKKHGLATKLALKLHRTTANKPAAQRKYRKLVAALNAALNTPEVLMAAGRFAEIRFASTASLCLQRHRKAFLNECVKGKVPAELEVTGNRHPEDKDRVAARALLREAIASKAVKGKQLGPHEIAAKLMGGRRGNVSTAERDLMEAQWVAMRQGVKEALEKAAEERAAAVLLAAEPAAAAAAGSSAAALASMAALKAALPKAVDLGKLVALVDVSGSMTGQPMEVAIGMGILVSELATDAFKDRVLTFETRPAWVDLSGCNDIAAKVAAVQSAGWGGSTDFAAACERILAAAEAARLTPDAIPDLIVFSDMQFNEAERGYGSYGHGMQSRSWQTHYERLEHRFAEVGRRICGQPYAPPRIIFWNLRGNTVGFPVDAHAPNTQMLSGFSPALLKLVLTGAELVAEEEEVTMADGSVTVKKSGPTPEQTLRAALDDAAYDAVRLRLSELKSGPLAAYSFTLETQAAEAGGVEADKAGASGVEAGEADEGFEMVDIA